MRAVTKSNFEVDQLLTIDEEPARSAGAEYLSQSRES
jgi:hypothetical protein